MLLKLAQTQRGGREGWRACKMGGARSQCAPLLLESALQVVVLAVAVAAVDSSNGQGMLLPLLSTSFMDTFNSTNS